MGDEADGGGRPGGCKGSVACDCRRATGSDAMAGVSKPRRIAAAVAGVRGEV